MVVRLKRLDSDSRSKHPSTDLPLIDVANGDSRLYGCTGGGGCACRHSDAKVRIPDPFATVVLAINGC
ncbi:hypothetical protein A2U01_0020888, partial [Trifolium medium]|nr:hypothetical protein [Trifolium medium]